MPPQDGGFASPQPAHDDFDIGIFPGELHQGIPQECAGTVSAQLLLRTMHDTQPLIGDRINVSSRPWIWIWTWTSQPSDLPDTILRSRERVVVENELAEGSEEMAVSRHGHRAGDGRGEWDESGHCRGRDTGLRGGAEGINDEDHQVESKVGIHKTRSGRSKMLG
jgi:hypothetical protein